MKMSVLLAELNIPIIEANQEYSTDFKSIVTQAIDETLLSLGEEVKPAFYFILEKKFGLNKEDIFHNIESITRAIESIFGESSLLLEIRIMRNLHEKVKTFEYKTKKGELSFRDYLAALKNSFDYQNSLV
jgi:hypothetical protein